MLACANCAYVNPDVYRFCGGCGAPLPADGCPSCGAVNPAGQQFCGQCGFVLDGGPKLMDAHVVEERKLVTILFADVVGFTSLSERTDPEVVARMVDGAFRELGEIVAAHGGTVDKFMGDSVMAVFGVPTAHDDDAERAVAAGLAMREVVGDLAFSIGINSGEVMATAVGRSDDVTVIGDTVNVAARLEKAAGPGEVLCGQLTAQLARDRVRFVARRPVLLKGKRESVEVWEASALHPVEMGSLREEATLIGREDESDFLTAQWRRIQRDRRSRVVLLCGEAGSGKTRLSDELARVATDDGLVVRAKYPAYGSLGGVAVAADIIRQLGPSIDPEVNARVRSIGAKLDPSLKDIDPTAVAQEQLWAFGRLLREKSQDEPLLVVIDDMHRCGDRTLELLGEMTGRLEDLAVLVVLAGRSEPPDWLLRFPAATTVMLTPLSDADAAMLARSLACDLRLAGDAVDLLVTRARGNPLYLRELMTVARDRGLLVTDGGQYHFTATAPVPATLQALLAARLDGLEPTEKLTVQHVTVLGDQATAERVAALNSSNPHATLRFLVESGLLRHIDGCYEAADSLLGEVAYETLPHNIRGELHRRAADLTGDSVERSRHLDLASQYLGDDPALGVLAADALVAAADDLVESSRHVDALRLLTRAIDLGHRQTSTLLATARLQALCGLADEAIETLGLVPDDPSDAKIAIEREHIAASTRVFTDPGWAVPHLADVAWRWREVGVKDKEAWAHANAGVAQFYLSHMDLATHELEIGLKLFEELGDSAGEVATSSFLSLASPLDPRVPGWLDRALEFADATGDRSKQISTLSTLTWNHFFRSICGGPQDVAAAEGFGLRLALLSEELGAAEMAVHARSLLAVMARLTGRIAQAADHVAALGRQHLKQEGVSWIGRAAEFAVLLADTDPAAASPQVPRSFSDPVVGMAILVIELGLTLAGRVEDAVRMSDSLAHHQIGVIGDLVGIVAGVGFVLAGRERDARRCAEVAAEVAVALHAGPAQLAAAALLAEISGDVSDLPPASEEADGIAGALALRARAVHGDSEATRLLRHSCDSLAMPGLLAGI